MAIKIGDAVRKKVKPGKFAGEGIVRDIKNNKLVVEWYKQEFKKRIPDEPTTNSISIEEVQAIKKSLVVFFHYEKAMGEPDEIKQVLRRRVRLTLGIKDVVFCDLPEKDFIPLFETKLEYYPRGLHIFAGSAKINLKSVFDIIRGHGRYKGGPCLLAEHMDAVTDTASPDFLKEYESFMRSLGEERSSAERYMFGINPLKGFDEVRRLIKENIDLDVISLDSDICEGYRKIFFDIKKKYKSFSSGFVNWLSKRKLRPDELDFHGGMDKIFEFYKGRLTPSGIPDDVDLDYFMDLYAFANLKR
jgi:hypothetical protein